MYGQDILCGISMGTLEIPHRMSYPYTERYHFLYDIENWKALRFMRSYAFSKRPPGSVLPIQHDIVASLLTNITKSMHKNFVVHLCSCHQVPSPMLPSAAVVIKLVATGCVVRVGVTGTSCKSNHSHCQVWGKWLPIMQRASKVQSQTRLQRNNLALEPEPLCTWKQFWQEKRQSGWLKCKGNMGWWCSARQKTDVYTCYAYG